MSSAPPAEKGAPAGPVILEGRDLEKTYEMGDRGLKVLRGVSIEVKKGEILAIQGPSGAGKSTLLHLLGLLDEPDRGRILFRGEDLLQCSPGERQRYRNEKVGFVFQFYHLFPDCNALENVCLPKMVGLSWAGYARERAAIEARAVELLALVGLQERMDHRPSELSGGERQRVAIARALMNEPEVLLCDEPTGNLDQKTAGEILDLLWRLNREKGQTFVMVTHDEGLARRADRVVRVVDGCLSEGGEARPRGYEETLFPLRAVPTRGVIHGPSLAAALAFIPGLALVWLFLLHDRFRRATGRGVWGWTAFLGALVPVVGNVWSFFLHIGPLRAANRILRANARPPLGWGRLVPLALWPIAWNLSVISGILLAQGEERAQPLGAASLLLLSGSAAWIQSLHNRFYDRMSRG